MSIDELDRVVRERLIGSPPHNLQHLGTLEKVNYIGTIGRIRNLGTIATIGTVLLTVHIGTVHKVDRLGTLDEMTRAGTLNRLAGGRIGTLGRLGTVHYVERVGTIAHLGSIDYIGTVNRLAGGRVGTLARLGSVHYTERIGTIQRLGTVKYLGTVRYLQAGSLGRVERLGTVGRVNYISKVGTISRVGTAHTGTVPINVAAQDIMTGVDLQARYLSTVDFRGTARLGCGSIWKGSWQAVDRYKTKMLLFQIGNRGTSGGGSIAVVAGMVGTTPYSGTFTLHARRRIGKGSLGSFSITEPVQYVRPWIRQHGGPGGSWQPESGGSVSTFLGRHV